MHKIIAVGPREQDFYIHIICFVHLLHYMEAIAVIIFHIVENKNGE